MNKPNNLFLLSISYFGPIYHYVLRLKYKTFIEVHENYQKRSPRNRCHILSANGPQTLSIPLKKGKTKTIISETLISYDENWPNNHLTSLASAYGTSPYFDYYYDKLNLILKKRHEKLIDLFLDIETFVTPLLDVPILKFTETYVCQDKTYNDLRILNDNYQFTTSTYNQVFEEKYGFVSNLSILDLIFNLGPESAQYIRNVKMTF